MKSEIIAVGSEMLTPFRQDTNSLFITEKLNEIGVSVAFKTVVGDRRKDLVERARAAGVGFQNSQWTFEGRVVITLEPRGTLWADQAVLEFRDGELAQLTATGSPARSPASCGSKASASASPIGKGSSTTAR